MKKVKLCKKSKCKFACKSSWNGKRPRLKEVTRDASSLKPVESRRQPLNIPYQFISVDWAKYLSLRFQTRTYSWVYELETDEPWRLCAKMHFVCWTSNKWEQLMHKFEPIDWGPDIARFSRSFTYIVHWRITTLFYPTVWGKYFTFSFWETWILKSFFYIL